MNKNCGCVIATRKNTRAVKKGYEMGGYVKYWCRACKEKLADAKKLPIKRQE